MNNSRRVRTKGFLVAIAVLMLLFGGACDNSGDTGDPNANLGCEIQSGAMGLGLLILAVRWRGEG